MRFCGYKLSKTLKEMGYSGEYSHIYSDYGFCVSLVDFAVLGERVPDYSTPAPRLDDAAYWLRDRYSLLISVDYGWCNGWQHTIITNYNGREPGVILGHTNCKTYEDTLASALEMAVEIIRDTNNTIASESGQQNNQL